MFRRESLLSLAPSHSVERQLEAALERALRSPRGRGLFALHLSRLPALRPHHGRIARSLMQDAAHRHDGQAFQLTNGDIALIGDGAALSGARSGDLPATLLRLFGQESLEPAKLFSLWPLTGPGAAMRLWLAECMAEPAGAPAEPAAPEPAAPVRSVDAIGDLVDHEQTAEKGEMARLAALMHRQTAVVAAPGDSVLRPIFHEVTFSVSALESRIAEAGAANRDPFLFRHLAARFDGRMLAVLSREVTQGGRMAQTGGQALHLNLTIRGILSAGFDAFAAAAQAHGVAAGVELSVIEVFADYAGFVAARAKLRETGIRLVLEGINARCLLMTELALLDPDLVKLDWSPALPSIPAHEQDALGEAIRRLDTARVVLQRVETEHAIAWGLSHGIRRFQGRKVDAILAAARPAAAAPQAAVATR